MLDSLENSPPRSAPAAAPNPRPCTGSLARHLQRHGLLPQLIATRRGPGAGGLPLSLSVRDYLASAHGGTGHTADALNDCLRHSLAGRIPVTLALSDLDYEGDPIRALESVCLLLKEVLRDQRQAQRLLGISLRSHLMPLQAYLVITSVLGKGPRYVMLDSLQMQHHADARVQAATDANWLELWYRRQGASCAVRPVYSESVRSRCALLGEEKTASILPVFAMPVPAASAWLPVEMYLPGFSDGHGRLDMAAVRAALHACLEASEHLVPQLFWASDRQRNDSATNNRLALLLSGIGDLVCQRRSDPGSIDCLRWVDGIVGSIHSELWNYSMQMAAGREILPSLLESEPAYAWHSAEHQRDWSGRWRQALRLQAVRHRNVLVMSPYSVLPGAGECSSAFTDLLPVLTHADAFSFRGAPAFSRWNVNEFSHFHRRAWAVITRESHRTRVAAGA